MIERNIKNEDRAFMLWNFLGAFYISAIRTLFGGQGQEAHKCVLAYGRVWVFVIMGFHFIRCVSVWALDKIINLPSYAQGQIAVMVKAEATGKTK